MRVPEPQHAHTATGDTVSPGADTHLVQRNRSSIQFIWKIRRCTVVSWKAWSSTQFLGKFGLFCLQVVDDKGREHEVLLRSFVHGQETMYLLDRLADLLHSVNAQAGDMLMLTRDETGPVVIPSPLVCTTAKTLQGHCQTAAQLAVGHCQAAAHPAMLCC